MREIVLASTSKWRKEILEKSGIPFSVEASGYFEDMSLPLPPEKLVEKLASGKAEAVAAKHKDAIVIGADTVAVFEGQVLGKPITPEKATQVLGMLSGKTHDVYTGYCIIDASSGKRRSGAVKTLVTFRNLSESEIAKYVQTGQPLNAAGAYTIQTGAGGFVSHIEGDFYNVVGLPLSKIVQELAIFGVTA